jgi:hypothetical protein
MRDNKKGRLWASCEKAANFSLRKLTFILQTKETHWRSFDRRKITKKSNWQDRMKGQKPRKEG